MKKERVKEFLHSRIKLNLEWLLDKFSNGGVLSRWNVPSAEFKRTTLQLRKDLIKYEKTFGYYFEEEKE